MTELEGLKKEIKDTSTLIEERLHDLLDHTDASAESIATMALMEVAAKIVVRRAYLGGGLGANFDKGLRLLTGVFLSAAYDEARKLR